MDLPLKDYQPQSKLVTPQNIIEEPRYPVIDAHNHLGETFGGGWVNRPVEEPIDVLDQSGVTTLIDLDGGWGEDILNRHMEHFKKYAPDRFAHFGGVNFSRWPDFGNRFGSWAAARLKDQVHRGAQGLKIWKGLGLNVKDQNNALVAVDDPRLDPLWATAGELGIPVTIHVADPIAFFDPLDIRNERWEELQANPDWQFPSPPFPSFLSIVDRLANMVKRHPETTFIGAHAGCYAENLAWVGALLDQAPNFSIDFSARLGELGRQPYTARRFFIQYADRILFGADLAPSVEEYRVYYRFLETSDEYFNYSPNTVPPQGRWQIYGIDLPDDVLRKIYQQNADRLILNRNI